MTTCDNREWNFIILKVMVTTVNFEIFLKCSFFSSWKTVGSGWGWFIWGPREIADTLLEVPQCRAVAEQPGPESRGNAKEKSQLQNWGKVENTNPVYPSDNFFHSTSPKFLKRMYFKIQLTPPIRRRMYLEEKKCLQADPSGAFLSVLLGSLPLFTLVKYLKLSFQSKAKAQKIFL